jgi:putative transposase
LEQAADLDGPVLSLVVGCTVGQQLPAADKVDRGGPQWRPRQGPLPSMVSVGDCFGNAMIEAFWSRMQVELLDRHRWRTRVEPASALFEYLEIFHNRQRRLSSLGMLTPIEFENTSTVA